MIFSSMLFLWVFFPILLILYFICHEKFKNLILLISSLIFYAWGEPKYIILMLISILINYILGILLDKYRNHDKIFLILAIIINIGLLGYFKYFNFILETINKIFHCSFILRDIALPIGISFYTFQILSYIIDLYRKEIKVQKNILDLSLYVSFFPQLVAGPIVKYKDIENEMKNRIVTLESFASGVKRFVYGMFKKVVIANTTAMIVDNILGNSMSELNTSLVWLAVISYTIQIYFDFSGYSDMAIGLGKMFGFHFPENFNLPYISQSITEFWRRWHISLSTWFKQYLYIPLGGNRKGKYRTYLNLFIVFVATGLWHGASFNFIVWGIYYGIFLIIERIFLKKILDKNKMKWLNHIYVLIVVMIGWVFFRAESLNDAISLLKLMFHFNFSKEFILMPSIINSETIFILSLGIIFSGFIQKIFQCIFKNKIKEIQNFYEKKLEVFVIILLMSWCILELVSSTYNPFIYFRF